MRRVLSILAVAACHTTAPAPPASDFGFYLLAMTWMPNLCCAHPCERVEPRLTLHGLWPNYTDEQSRGRPRAWPQFCGRYAHCEQSEDASCAPTTAVPAELAAFAPGYLADHGALATHEWSKHGSCTSLPVRDYFAAELAAIRVIPKLDALSASAGHDLARADLQRAFGVAPDAVVLGCDERCRLTQVGFCIAKDARDRPVGPLACSANVTTSDYDNGCVTRHCDRVVIESPASCTVSSP